MRFEEVGCLYIEKWSVSDLIYIIWILTIIWQSFSLNILLMLFQGTAWISTVFYGFLGISWAKHFLQTKVPGGRCPAVPPFGFGWASHAKHGTKPAPKPMDLQLCLADAVEMGWVIQWAFRRFQEHGGANVHTFHAPTGASSNCFLAFIFWKAQFGPFSWQPPVADLGSLAWRFGVKQRMCKQVCLSKFLRKTRAKIC